MTGATALRERCPALDRRAETVFDCFFVGAVAAHKAGNRLVVFLPKVYSNAPKAPRQ
jgi:hypothetical protein